VVRHVTPLPFEGWQPDKPTIRVLSELEKRLSDRVSEETRSRRRLQLEDIHTMTDEDTRVAFALFAILTRAARDGVVDSDSVGLGDLEWARLQIQEESPSDDEEFARDVARGVWLMVVPQLIRQMVPSSEGLSTYAANRAAEMGLDDTVRRAVVHAVS